MSSPTPTPFVRLGPGSVVEGRYEVLSELGRGGMGTVYEARQIKLDKRVALKVLQPERAWRDDDGNSQKRFLREARVASAIHHRNVVDIIDFGDLEDGSTYYVMELLQGQDLASILKERGPLSWAELRPLLRQVVGALGAAHDAGVIHRDVKPGNVMLLDEPDEWGNPWVKVLDFGIAKVQEADGDTQSLTGTSELLGTAAYMGPELAKGERADARTDLYAVGILAYQMLTGDVPFSAPNTFQVLLRHMTDPPQPPRELDPSIPEVVEAFVLRAIAKERDDRYQTAAQMAAAIDELDLAGAPSGATGRRLVVRSGPEQSTSVIDAAIRARQITGDVAPPSGRSRAVETSSNDPSSGISIGPARTSVLRPILLGVGAAAVVVAVWLIGRGSSGEPQASPSPATEPPAVAAEKTPEPTEPSGAAETGAEVVAAGGSTAAPEPAGTTAAGPISASSGPEDGSTTGEVEPPPEEPPQDNPERCQTPACKRKAAENRLRRAVRRRCRSLGTGETVTVKLTIGTDGRVLMPRALAPHGGSALGKCVVETVAKGRFPAPPALEPTEMRFKP